MEPDRSAEQWIASHGLPILMYHRVGPPAGGPAEHLNVTPQTFARQVHWLRDHGYTGVSLRDVLHAPSSLPARPVALTFDDGYADLYHHALPVLSEHGFAATMFIVSSHIGGASSWDSHRGWPALPLLSAPQIRALAKDGIEIGAHGRTHRDLTGLAEADLQDEIAGSRRDLEDLLSAPVLSFAYPYGSFDDRALQAVRREFRCACTVTSGINRRRTDLHRLRRTMVLDRDTDAIFGRRVRLGRNPVEELRAQGGGLKQRIRAAVRR